MYNCNRGLPSEWDQRRLRGGELVIAGVWLACMGGSDEGGGAVGESYYSGSVVGAAAATNKRTNDMSRKRSTRRGEKESRDVEPSLRCGIAYYR